MQRALRNTLRLKTGQKNWNNKLISPLFENITTLAQLYQFTRAEGTTEETSHNSIGHGTQVPPETRATVNSSVMNTCHFTRADPHGDVSCMAEMPIGLNTPLSHASTLSPELIQRSPDIQVLKPQDSRICVLHASNTSSMEECVCRTTVHLDFNS